MTAAAADKGREMGAPQGLACWTVMHRLVRARCLATAAAKTTWVLAIWTSQKAPRASEGACSPANGSSQNVTSQHCRCALAESRACVRVCIGDVWSIRQVELD
mmetsp:Transcript_12448/g.34292  ORF Transcript_12448/g.34292 Transcript_12448/m.34292 type:complete len:103 (+) Transcript_12448:275-583(+)